jgi:hypothetical protein
MRYLKHTCTKLRHLTVQLKKFATCSRSSAADDTSIQRFFGERWILAWETKRDRGWRVLCSDDGYRPGIQCTILPLDV